MRSTELVGRLQREGAPASPGQAREVDFEDFAARIARPGQRGVPVKILDSEGNILDITSVKFSPLNGGEIHIEAEEPDEE